MKTKICTNNATDDVKHNTIKKVKYCGQFRSNSNKILLYFLKNVLLKKTPFQNDEVTPNWFFIKRGKL